MLKRLLLITLFMTLQAGLMAQYGFTSAQLEQRKKHARVNLHTELELTGKIRKLLYEPVYEYLNGFILETEEGKAFKIEHYFFIGQVLYPYLKKGEQISVKVKGDSELLTRMLYKSDEDKRAERQLGVKLSGLAYLQRISSSHGMLDLPNYDKANLPKVPAFEIVTDANIIRYTMGKRNSIQLILDTGDTINTYQTDRAKPYYIDGKVSYVRHLSALPGAYQKTSKTYHMVSPYVSTKILPTAKDLKINTVGMRSAFLDKAENFSFASMEKSAKGKIIITRWTDDNGESHQMSFNRQNEGKFNDFLAGKGRKGLTLHYRKGIKPRMNYLYAIEKSGERTLLNETEIWSGEADNKEEGSEETNGPTASTESTEPQATKGTLLKFLTTKIGLYAGFILVDQSLDTLTFRLWNTHGKKVLENFREGDEIEVDYEYITTRQIINEKFDNMQVDLTTFYNPTGRSLMEFYIRYPWMSTLDDDPNYDKEQKRFKKKSYYATHLSKDDLNLDIKPEYGSPEKIYNPTEISLDVKVLGIDKKKGDTRFYMENGDTLYMNTANGIKKGKRVSYTRIHPIVANGQIYDDPGYQNRVLQTVWVEKRKVGALSPIYDEWMRLSGYESKIQGNKGLIRLAPDMGKAVNEYISRNKTKDLTLLCNQFDISKSMPTFYFFIGLTNSQGELVFDDHVREPQHYEVDTVFTSRVKEIIKHSDLYTYRNTTLVLENGYVFSVNNDTFRSIEANALVGSSLTLKGKPFIPRQGEVLKEKDYKLIKPSFLKAGNVEFKISD